MFAKCLTTLQEQVLFLLGGQFYSLTGELPGVALGNISNGLIFTGKSNTFVYSDISSYARLQSLNSDSKQTTGRINLKLIRVTPAGLEGFEELSTAYKFLVSEAPS